MSSLKKSCLKKGYHCIPFKLTKTNHLVVKVKLNGKKGRFILDTGASNSCIGFDTVVCFSAKTRPSEVMAAGAGATGMKTEKSFGNVLRIAGWKEKNIDLVVFDLSHVNGALKEQGAKKITGILGADVFKKCEAVIDYSKNSLYLK
jgi:predicted aspartyl protease